MLGRDKLDNTLLTCDQGNFNQITARSRNQTLVTVVRDMCPTSVPPAPRLVPRNCQKLTSFRKVKNWSYVNSLSFLRALANISLQEKVATLVRF